MKRADVIRQLRGAGFSIVCQKDGTVIGYYVTEVLQCGGPWRRRGELTRLVMRDAEKPHFDGVELPGSLDSRLPWAIATAQDLGEKRRKLIREHDVLTWRVGKSPQVL